VSNYVNKCIWCLYIYICMQIDMHKHTWCLYICFYILLSTPHKYIYTVHSRLLRPDWCLRGKNPKIQCTVMYDIDVCVYIEGRQYELIESTANCRHTTGAHGKNSQAKWLSLCNTYAIYVYMYICIYNHTSKCIYIDIYIYICIYIYKYIYTYKYTHIYVYIYICINIHMYIFTYVYFCIHMYAHIHVYISTYMYM